MSDTDSSNWQSLGAASQLQDSAVGLRFEVGNTQKWPAFAIRHQGQVHAYLNQCAHVAMEMDWQAGQFFDADRTHLICASHGALYSPTTGLCISGPCIGRSLTRVPTKIDNETLYASRTI